MEEINEQLNNLHKKITSVNNIDALKSMRHDFTSTYFAFADVHKKLERGIEFDWNRRFDPVIAVLDNELESGNFESARSSMLSNIEAMQTFKKNAGELMNYECFRNENKVVDRKEKIEYLKKKSNIDGFRMEGAYHVHNQVAELNRILWGLSPIEKNKDTYDYTRISIEYSLKRLLEGSEKWSTSKRPTESTQRDWRRVKGDLQDNLEKCFGLLEEVE